MVADEQTHTVPSDRTRLENFARFCGFSGREDFANALLQHLRNVQRHYASLFEDAALRGSDLPKLVFSADADDRETLDRLTELGFRRPLEISALVRRWTTPVYDSLRGAFAREQLSHRARVAAPFR